MAVTTVIANAAGDELTYIALRQNRALREAFGTLENIAMLTESGPLAAEMAVQGMRDMRDIIAGPSDA